jgi:hypothetical protein
MMVDPKKLYRELQAIQRYRSEWYDKLVGNCIDTVVKQGFIDPKCYVLEYSPGMKAYSTTIFELDPDELQDPVKHHELYGMLYNLDKYVPNPIAAVSMVSEGTFNDPVNGGKASYLMISFETPIESQKTAYKLVKRREIADSGEVLRIMSMEKDEVMSADRSIFQLEKFTHILRKNISDETDRTIYN